MTRAWIVAVLLAFGSSNGVAQDYTNATNAAWCSGALSQLTADWRAGLANLAPETQADIERELTQR